MRTAQNRFRKQALIQAGGVAALSALAGAAEAVPIYSGLQNINLSGNGNSVNLDLNSDTFTDISFVSNFYGAGNANFHVGTSQVNGTTVGTFEFDKALFVTRFADGGTIGTGTLQSVGSGTLFASESVSPPQWSGLNPVGYLGFKLSSGEYGWAYISSVANGQSSSITIRDWAYGDVAGASINAGDGISSAVPEPGTAALMLAAGVAVALKRRFGKR